MIDYNINNFETPYSVLGSVEDMFVTSTFVPKPFKEIGEFTHFGSDLEDDEEYNEDSLYQNLLDFVKNTLKEEQTQYDGTGSYVQWAYTNPSEVEGIGDLVKDYDAELWQPQENKSTQQVPQASTYNVQKAITTLERNAHSKSTKRCAEYVRWALNAGNVPITGKGNANGYGRYFMNSDQWTQIEPGDIQPGDVCAIFNNKDGHLSMWTGKEWISDFRQKGPHVYKYAKDGVNTFYFRYTG